jgi:hypothetical protein
LKKLRQQAQTPLIPAINQLLGKHPAIHHLHGKHPVIHHHLWKTSCHLSSHWKTCCHTMFMGTADRERSTAFPQWMKTGEEGLAGSSLCLQREEGLCRQPGVAAGLHNGQNTF